MNSEANTTKPLFIVVEEYAYSLYCFGAVIVGLLESLEMFDTLFKWSQDSYGAWSGPLICPCWLAISAFFVVIFLVRRRMLLIISPAVFLFQFLLMIVIGPFLVSAKGHLNESMWAARTGMQQLEPFDVLYSVLGLLYAVLNIWLLVRHVRGQQTKKQMAALLLILIPGLVCAPGFALDQHAERFQKFQAEGIKLLQARDYVSALKSFAAAMKEHSDSWQVWLNVGICHLRTGDYKATVSEVQRSIKLGGVHAGQCITMSGAYEGLGEPSKALSWLELACSVEPAQAENPAIKAKIQQLKDPMKNPAGKPDDPDYVIGLSAIQKWHVADFPIKVLVRKNAQMPEFYEQFEPLVKASLDEWCKATDDLVKYKFVNDLNSANVIFDYTGRRDTVSREHEPGIEGNSENRVRMEDRSIDGSTITVLVKDAPGAPAFQKPYMIKKVLLHEIGHMLGMHGHSPNPLDVMFSAATPYPFAMLSKRDINTIRRVYGLPPTDLQLQAFEFFKSKNIAKAIECFQAALKEQPNSWQILQSIGTCYMELGRYDTAIEYFEKSVRLGGLHHVSQCTSLTNAYQKVEKNGKVWEWLQTACWMDPATEADPAIQATIKQLEYAIDHPSGSPESPDYLAGIFKTDKWKMDTMPLKAYVKPNTKLASLHNEFTEIVRDAMDQWCAATNGIVSYKFVDKPEGANLLWTYSDNGDDCNTVCEMGLAGATDLKVHAIDEKPELATIVVLVKDKPVGPIRNRQLLAKICLHEIGHALGMNGHSPNDHDVMYPSSSIYDKAAPVLSARDKNTIRKLYQTIK